MPITINPQSKPKGIYKLPESELFNQTKNAFDILRTMNDNTYEELVASWAYWCLKDNDGRKYEDVMRIGGTGDRGIDVIAYYNQKENICDIYQCKHYNHPIRRSDVIAEIGKFMYYMSTGAIPVPESYYLMAPQGIGSHFMQIYGNATKLKKDIIDNWDKDIADNIEEDKQHLFEGRVKEFVEGFDYTRFKLFSPDRFLQQIVESEKRFVYFQYFGYHKEYLRKIVKSKPTELDDYEKVYITHLLNAYNDVKDVTGVDMDTVAGTTFGKHFEYARDQFWLAESIKKMSEENCPGDTDEFGELKDDMDAHVQDTYEEEYEDAFKRVKAVTDKATSMPLKANRIVSGELGTRERKGLCYHLSNENRLIWKKEEKS